MKHRWGKWTLAVLCLLVVSGCTQATQQATQTNVNMEPRSLLNIKGTLFSTSGQCSACHTGLKTSAGTDISIDTAWRSTMMANSARDPYYRASVRREILANSKYDEFIQNKCSTCHVPMAHFTLAAADEKTLMLDEGVFSQTNPNHSLALDGVSCTLCHQIQADELGTADSFSGGLVFDDKTAAGERELFGQFAVADNWVSVMKAASGYAPIKAEHTRQSELCAACHNLFTPYITKGGQVSQDLFPEQTPFTEWQNSMYSWGVACQDCHMPDAGEAVAISSVNPEVRSPFRQHTFIGGNRFMLSLLQENGDKLEVTAQDEHFAQTVLLTEQQLAEKTAKLSLKGQLDGSVLSLDVKIDNLTGHKFPTSFPSRRVWLHVLVKDSGGTVVFESGGWNGDGAIAGNINDQDPLQFEPHYQTINAPDQVQIYEAIIGDSEGNVTTTLLRAKNYLKDNRLLASGMNKAALPVEIAVVGDAAQDETFTAGGDSVRYIIQLPQSATYQITAELLYQSIGYRWTDNLRGFPVSDEANQFLEMLKETPLTPVLVAQAKLDVSKP
jgi:hypothetical protein